MKLANGTGTGEPNRWRTEPANRATPTPTVRTGTVRTGTAPNRTCAPNRPNRNRPNRAGMGPMRTGTMRPEPREPEPIVQTAIQSPGARRGIEGGGGMPDHTYAR